MASQAQQTHWTVSDLALRWSVSPNFIRRKIWDGELVAARFGRAIRVSEAEARRFEEGHATASSGEPTRNRPMVVATAKL
ncbi:MAG: helix-turn-helix domain-containing protein [Deltaproteobacteria bacterium]|nr:helix-turn-helix domain-containing protein [Deltaproteobacteria bacterium]